MKLGNISQTIIPVPNFFTDKNNRTVEIFKDNRTKRKLKRNKSYFRTSDILTTNCDLNLNNNPRTFTNGWKGSETKKYIPIYDRGVFTNNAEKKNTYFPNIIDTSRVRKIEKPSNKNEFHNAHKFLKQTNLNTFLKKDLRNEIMDNTKNLIDRINVTFDMNKWNEFDSRTTMNTILQTAYSPLIDAIYNTNDYKKEFMKTLDEKSLNLTTISDKARMSIVSNIKKKEKNNVMNRTINGLMRNKSDLDALLSKNRTNLLNLKNNNKEPPEYSEKDQKFIEENANITRKINKCNLYKNFPSKTRMEFEVKKVFPRKKKFGFNDDWGCINIKNYKSKKENFCSLDPMWIRPLHIDAFKIRK
jgi:hypothetical protein